MNKLINKKLIFISLCLMSIPLSFGVYDMTVEDTHSEPYSTNVVAFGKTPEEIVADSERFRSQWQRSEDSEKFWKDFGETLKHRASNKMGVDEPSYEEKLLQTARNVHHVYEPLSLTEIHFFSEDATLIESELPYIEVGTLREDLTVITNLPPRYYGGGSYLINDPEVVSVSEPGSIYLIGIGVVCCLILRKRNA
jgi:hypothetical protein